MTPSGKIMRRMLPRIDEGGNVLSATNAAWSQEACERLVAAAATVARR